jgi:hypothetical protein
MNGIPQYNLSLNEMSEEKQLIDDAFYVEKARFLWHSKDKDGNGLVSAVTEAQCINATRFYLKGKQEGWNEDNSRVVNDGTVGGKL